MQRLQRVGRLERLCIFCGSSLGNNPAYERAARELARELFLNGFGLVYGGGGVGLMGIIAREMMQLGGEVIGVIPKALLTQERADSEVTKLHVVETMHERKALMEKLSHGAIAMPGGFGTWDEFFEILTWAQLGYHSKLTALFNVEGYYDSLLRQIDRSVEDGFVKPSFRNFLKVGHQAKDLVAFFNKNDL